MSETRRTQAPSGASQPRADVGYKRPPPERQFKKGVSGNPNGRPRKAAAPASLGVLDFLLQEAHSMVTITENNIKKTMPASQAIARRFKVQAINGDRVAARRFLAMTRDAEQRKTDAESAQLAEFADYKRQWTQEIQRCREQGEAEPDPVPHPREIAIDPATGKVSVNGPRNEIEKAEWDQADRDRQACQRSIDGLKQYRDSPNRSTHVSNIDSYQQTKTDKLAELDRIYPRVALRRRPGFNLQKHRAKKTKPPVAQNPTQPRRTSSKKQERT